MSFRIRPLSRQWMFSVIYFFIWAGYASFTMDFLFYSTKIGLSNTQIGMLLSANGLISIMCQPLFGMLCDRIRSTRIMTLGSLLCGAALSLLLPGAGKIGAVCIVLTYTFCMCSCMPLLDNWVARESASPEFGFHYGHARLWGSIGYAIVAFTYGQITERMDLTVVYYGRAIFFAVTLVFVALFRSADSARAAAPKASGNVKELFRNRAYLLFVAFTFFFSMPLATANSFFPKLLLSVGGSNSTIGLFASLNAIVEIPFFLYGHRLTRRFGSHGLILAGCAFVLLRMIGFSFASSIPALMFFYFCIAPYTSLFTPGMIFYVRELSPEGSGAFAQTLLQAVSIGLSGMIGNFIGGRIIDAYGIRPLYGGGSVIAIAAFLFFVLVASKRGATHGKDD